jgi:hypothetical protein
MQHNKAAEIQLSHRAIYQNSPRIGERLKNITYLNEFSFSVP